MNGWMDGWIDGWMDGSYKRKGRQGAVYIDSLIHLLPY